MPDPTHGDNAPANVQVVADAMNRGCWVTSKVGNEGHRFYQGTVVGIVTHPLTKEKFYQVRTRDGVEMLHPSLIILCPE